MVSPFNMTFSSICTTKPQTDRLNETRREGRLLAKRVLASCGRPFIIGVSEQAGRHRHDANAARCQLARHRQCHADDPPLEAE